MARPYWSGQVQISLVSFGISLYTATNAASQVRLHQIDRNSGERIHHRNVTADDSGEVENSDIVKGYEYRKGEYITIEPEELEKLRLPSKKALAITQFVDRSQLPLSLFEKPYFVVPQNESQTASFVVIREALKETGTVALGEIAFGGREHLIALMPAHEQDAQGMMAYTLRYQNELRSASEYFSNIQDVAVEKDQLDLAKELIERKTAPFLASKFKDDYEDALRAWIEAKTQHLALPEDEEQPKRAKVINLMDALRKSLGEKNAEESPAKKTAASTPKRASSRSKEKGPRLVSPTSQRKRKSA